MAINLYIRLMTTKEDVERLTQHYKETYRFQATGDDADADIQNYRLRHFLTVNAPNSTVTPNTGLMVYDGTGINHLTASYNDWTTPNRPPKFDEGNSQFNTELIMRFDVAGRRFRDLPTNMEAWLTVPYANDNGVFTPIEISHAFSFLGYSNNNEYVKNPMNILLEHKVSGGVVSVIETLADTMPSGRLPDCSDAGNMYKVETVRVETQSAHGLKVGDAVTLYSRSVSHVPSYTGKQGRLFGLYDDYNGVWKGRGERYLGDFVVTSVPTSTSFTYNTYHNPMKINKSYYPNGQRYTHDDWNDLVWEKWELYEYTESVSASETGSSVVFTFTDSDPSGVTCSHNFSQNDIVTFVYNGSTKLHFAVDIVGSNSITATPVDGESFPSGVTSGTLVYTPRLPSSDVAHNVAHDDIAPVKTKSHSSDSAIFYACQDTYYDKNSPLTACYGDSATLLLAYNQRIPILKFPIPFYNGAATVDPHMVARLFVYCNSASGSPNAVNVFDFTDNWTETITNGEIARIHPGSWTDDVVGHMAKFDASSPTRTTANRYLGFDISPEFVANMFTDPSHTKSVYLNIESDILGSGNSLVLASREDDDAHWPYITISSPVFIGRTAEVELDNTYMYLVCERIEKTTYGGGSAFCATVSSKIFDPSNIMYVRSWSSDKPFFAAGDKIEIMNTEHYNTVSAQVIGVDYDAHKVYFCYPDGEPVVETVVSECGIIRNKSRMISTYVATDADNVTSNLSVTGPNLYGTFGYSEASVEFDVIHDGATDGSTSLSAVYSDGDVTSNTETPVIITDIDVLAIDGGHDREVDRFMHVGPDNAIVLKGFNLNTLTANATAVLGSIAWENGMEDAPTATLSIPDNGDTNARQFEYSNDFDLQKTMPVYELRNVGGVTEFKVLKSDCPFRWGDVVAPILTGMYVDGTHSVPPDGINYGKNYYIADEPQADGSYVWIRLSSAYISRLENPEDSTPSYVYIGDNDVAYINRIIPSSGKLTANDVPLVLYSTVTSVTVHDTGVNTNLYYNRLYLQIDEEPPICHVSEQVIYAGVDFDVYLADLNEIYIINGYKLKDYPDGNNFPLGKLDRLLGENDDRFIKLTLNLLRSTTLEIYDAAGNYTSLWLEVNSTHFMLDITGISSSGTTHTLQFTVKDTEESLLSTDIANTAGNTGIYASFGNIQNISSISEGDDAMYYFTFDLVLTEDVLSQSDGKLEVWAGDTNTGGSHQNDKWCSPIIFQKNFTCVETGNVLQYRGVNLYETDTKKLELRGPNPSSFSIDTINSTTSISIKVVDTRLGNKSFALYWKNDDVPPAVSNYVNTVTITQGPSITIETQTVKLKKGTDWSEPGDVTATDYRGVPFPESEIEISIDNTNWDESGIHTITYTVTDECGRSASVQRKVIVTECDIPIITTKCSDAYSECVYGLDEDIEILISPESAVLFNQYVMNNIVYYQLNGSTEWIAATIISGTSDRKSITIKNPGVLASGMTLMVDVGENNNTANGCYATNHVKFSVVSKENQDKPLNVYGKASLVKKNSSRSRFDDLNFEPVYNKDLSYSSFSITADENSLMQNVYSILLTNLGERLYDDEFGSTLEENVFDIIGDLNGESKLLNQCVTLINKYEPRAVVVEDKSYVAITEDNTVAIVLYIKVPRGIARKIELTFRKNT